MRWQIVHDDDVAGGEFWGKDLLHVSAEGVAIHWAIERHRRREAADPLKFSRPDEGGGLNLAEFPRMADNSLQDATNSLFASINTLFGANNFPVPIPRELFCNRLILLPFCRVDFRRMARFS
jgi:hypothetical protein